MKNQYIPKFPSKLRELLVSKGMTQRDLSDKTGINKAQISQYCTGHRRPSIETLVIFSDAIDTKKGEKTFLTMLRWLRNDIKNGGMTCFSASK